MAVKRAFSLSGAISPPPQHVSKFQRFTTVPLARSSCIALMPRCQARPSAKPVSTCVVDNGYGRYKGGPRQPEESV